MRRDNPDQVDRVAVGAMTLGALASWFIASGERIADDAYFYLVTARNLVVHGEHSFNRIVPTNGTHPLWLYVVTGWSWLVRHLDPAALQTTTHLYPLSATLYGLALVALLRLGRLLDVRMTPAMLVMGLFAGLGGVLGSEAHLSLAALVLFAIAFVRADQLRTDGAVALTGLAAGLATLARLDSGIIGLAAAAYVLRRTRSRRLAAVLLAAFLAVLVPYLCANVLLTGGAVPVSGWLKSSLPSLHVRGLEPFGLATTLRGVSLLFGLAPLVAACLILRRLPETPARALLAVLWVAGATQAAYIALFADGVTCWYWYWTLDCLVIGLALSLALGELPPAPLTHRIATVVALLMVAAGAALPLHAALKTPGDRTHSLRAADLIADNSAPTDTVLISDYPGRVAFEHPTRSVLAADLLTTSRALAQSLLTPGARNPLDLLQDVATAAGRPIRYVAVMGTGVELTASKDRQRVIFRHPKSPRPAPPDGTWSLGAPIAEVPSLGWAMWRVPEVP